MDRKKFPVALAGAYVKDKTDLFRCWLSSSQDWSKLLASIVCFRIYDFVSATLWV
jgi:hypothetical protein